MKYEKLKKQLLVESAIITAVMVVLSAIIYLISAIRDDYVAGNEQAQKQVDAVDLEMNTLRGRYTNIQKNIKVYEEVLRKQQEGRLAINRQMVLERFNQYKNQYLLSSLRLNATPAADLKEALFKRKASSVNFSDVVVDFEVTSDESVYALLDSLREELPGISKIVRMNMTLVKPFGDDVVTQLVQKGSFPMVRANIRFIWFGINTIETPDAKDAKPDAAKK